LHSSMVTGSISPEVIGTEKFYYESNVNKVREQVLKGCHRNKIVTFGDPCLSYLAVFGPRAFPIALLHNRQSVKHMSVVIAGAHYGKGRVVVLGHENLLQTKELMKEAAVWVSGNETPGAKASKKSVSDQLQKPRPGSALGVSTFGASGGHNVGPTILLDPSARHWTAAGWAPCNPWDRMVNPFGEATLVPRSELSNMSLQLSFQEGTYGAPVYVTQGHHDDDADEILAFVKNGGGLIIAGHSWWWAETLGAPQTNVMLDHPGNRIVTHFGIAFSNECQPGKFISGSAPPLESHWRWSHRSRKNTYHKEIGDLFPQYPNAHKRIVNECTQFQSIVKMLKTVGK